MRATRILLLKPLFSARGFSSEIFVSRLSGYTTKEELIWLFSKFGVVKEARLIKDQQTQRPKGFGFVKFEKEVDAEKSVKAMNGRDRMVWYGTDFLVRKLNLRDKLI